MAQTVYSPAISTYEPLETIVLDNAASSVTFFNISQDYRDLVIVANGQTDTPNSNMQSRFNGDSGSNYSWVYMGGNGSTTFSGATSGTQGDWGNFPNSPSVSVFQIMDYSDTTKHKTTLVRSNTAATYAIAYANRWASTSAITMITLNPSGGAFNSGTTFTLFGIAS